MRILLRLLIALNWTVAGLSAMEWVYAYGQIWSYDSSRLASEQITRDAPDLKVGTDEYYRQVDVLADEYRAKTKRTFDRGHLGWCVAMLSGAATAIGLMVVFPRVKVTSRPN